MRRLRMLPVSIAAHVVAALALLIIPLAAEMERPVPAPLARPEFLAAKAVPAPPAPSAVRTGEPARSSATAAPIAAGSGIPPDPPVQPSYVPPGVAVEGGVGGAGEVPGGVETVVTVPEPPPVAPPPPPRIVRVGGDIREPRKVVDVRPVYPPLAQAGRVEGTVVLEAVINERGTIERIKVLRSVPLLDAAAVDAVRQWRYTPTLLNGVPVGVLMTIYITFSVHD